MKKQVVVFMLFLMLAIPCLAQSQEENGSSAKGMKLAVLEPEGEGLSEDERWMLSLIQSSITADFNKYSAITVIDRQNLEAIIAEQKRSLEAATSDEEGDAIRIGNLANATHVLSGKITKTPNAFMLELAVTDVESGVRKASYSPSQVTPKAMENLSALKEASSDLLKQLGVNLTASQLAELKGPVTEIQIQAQTALAHGVVAQRQGTSVAALSYYYQAASFDPSLLEAVSRSSVMSANISGANLGENIRNDILWRRGWVERLKETEETFYKIIRNASPPYTLFYSTGIKTKDINYKTETANLSTPINLTANLEWFNAMKQALKAAQAVLDGLNATNRKKDWELANWPVRGVSNTNPFASLFSSSKQYDLSVEFELVNQDGKVIGRQAAKLRPSFSIGIGNSGQFAVNFEGNTSSTLTFNSVKADDITDNLTIRPASVNGASPEAAGFSITAISAEKRKEEQAQGLVFRIENGIVMGFSKSLSDSVKARHLDLVIPSEVWGQPVTAIAAKAFENFYIPGRYGYDRFSSVTIPNTVTSIGEKAFFDAEFTSITIGSNVTIGINSFGETYTYDMFGGERCRRNCKVGNLVVKNLFQEYYEKNGKKAGVYSYKRGDDGWNYFENQEVEQKWREEKRRTEWLFGGVLLLGGGKSFNTNNIDPYFKSSGGGQWNIMSLELCKRNLKFFRFGGNLDLGVVDIDKDEVIKKQPDGSIDDGSIDNTAYHFKVNAFTRLYPADFLFLSGGAGLDIFHASEIVSIFTPVFPVGGGIVLSKNQVGLFIEVLYNMLPFQRPNAAYISINVGVGFLPDNL